MLKDLAVLFTTRKGNITSAPVAKCGNFKGKSAKCQSFLTLALGEGK